MTNVDLLKTVIEDKQQTAAALSIADDLVRVDLSLADARALLAELESQAADPVAAGVEWTAEQLKAGLAEIAAQRPKLDGDKVHEAMWGIILEERRKVAELEKRAEDNRELAMTAMRGHAAALEENTALTSQVATLTKERDEARAAEQGLYDKCKSLSAHGTTCACALDRPDDVCAHHSPQLTRALAQLAAAKQRAEEAETPKCPKCGAEPEIGWDCRVFQCDSHYLHLTGDKFSQTSKCRIRELENLLAANLPK